MISMFGRYQRNAFYGHDGMLKSLQPNDKILFPPKFYFHLIKNKVSNTNPKKDVLLAASLDNFLLVNKLTSFDSCDLD